MKSLAYLFLILSLIFLLTLLLSGCDSPPKEAAEIKPAEYADEQLCFSCHQQQHQEWQNSHHDMAMKEATSETVLGDFNNASFTHFGVTSKFFQKDGKYFVNTEGPDGQFVDYEIKYTFGIDPLQQYLIEFPGGRLQSLTIAWDAEKKEWYHLYPDEKVPPDDPLHWTKVYQNWNAMCAECHSTNLKKNFNLTTDSYKTTWSSINVSCQACHGPGSNHVEWANAAEKEENKTYPAEDKLGLEMRLTAVSSRVQVETCAPCHSRRHRVSVNDNFGKPFLDNFSPALLRETLYHSDGQILDEVYVYGSFAQSKMFHKGVRCTDCHNPHTAKLIADGNALCVRCHNSSPPPQFSSIKSQNYDSPEHHFHEAGKSGAYCVDCHMPSKKYMVIDPRRDHGFRIPRPDLSEKLGTPNACNGCHNNKSAEWAAGKVEEWYQPNYDSPHFAEVIAGARAGAPDVEADLIELALNTGQPAIIRSTAIELLRNYGPAGMTAIVQATSDKSPLVRSTAISSMENAPERLKKETALLLLDDPVRAVRNEAARIVSHIPIDSLSTAHRITFENALLEFEKVMKSEGDQPSAHMNLGIVYTNQGRVDLAEEAYKNAIQLDSYFLPAYVNLALLYNQTRRNKKAEQLYLAAIERAPENGDLYYSLGLLYAESRALDKASESLKIAADLMPNRPRVIYNYALTLQHLGKRPEAERQLLRAYKVNPGDPDFVHALTIFYIQDEDWRQAHHYVKQLVFLTQGAPGPRQMEQQIREKVEKM